MSRSTRLAAAALALALGAQAEAGTLGVFQSDAQGFDTRTYWYDDGREVTVFDTQFTPALAEQMVAAIRAATANPITRVIVTHPNPDKFNGLSVFHALGATSIASAATAAALPEVDACKRAFWISTGAFTAASYPRLEAVRQSFTGQHRITLASGETITLTELRNPGVSTTQTVARIDATGDLIVGDLVHGNAHAWLEGGVERGAPRPDIAAWIRALEELPALGGRMVRGGRGDDLPVAEAVAQQADYLGRMDALVADYVAALGERRTELRDPALAPGHHAAIQRAAEAAFPGRRLSYLVGYGVYGLVGSRL